MGLIFKKAKFDDVTKVIDLIKTRIVWMNQNNISHWNKSDYLNTFPESYFINLVKNGQLYVLVENNEIICAGSIKEHDNFWKGLEENAFYVHNLVSKIGTKNISKIFLNNVEVLCKTFNKKYLRLDAMIGNEKLNNLYRSLGFTKVGEYHSCTYNGNLLQKEMKEKI